MRACSDCALKSAGWPKTGTTCFYRYVVTDCDSTPRLIEPIRDPARLDWNEVTKVAHYYLAVNAMTKLVQVRENFPPYGGSS
jgi:hypothetical protein